MTFSTPPTTSKEKLTPPKNVYRWPPKRSEHVLASRPKASETEMKNSKWKKNRREKLFTTNWRFLLLMVQKFRRENQLRLVVEIP